eukprot:366412-Chlamydomonas_euryale.AAC.14
MRGEATPASLASPLHTDTGQNPRSASVAWCCAAPLFHAWDSDATPGRVSSASRHEQRKKCTLTCCQSRCNSGHVPEGTHAQFVVTVYFVLLAVDNALTVAGNANCRKCPRPRMLYVHGGGDVKLHEPTTCLSASL